MKGHSSISFPHLVPMCVSRLLCVATTFVRHRAKGVRDNELQTTLPFLLQLTHMNLKYSPRRSDSTSCSIRAVLPSSSFVSFLFAVDGFMLDPQRFATARTYFEGECALLVDLAGLHGSTGASR